jgi:hypothetical protein
VQTFDFAIALKIEQRKAEGRGQTALSSIALIVVADDTA